MILYWLDSHTSGDMSLADILCSGIKNLQIRNLFYDSTILNHGWNIMLRVSQSLTMLDLLTYEDSRFHFDLAS